MSLTPYFQTKNGVLYHGDCFKILPEISNESIDLILTDPPYGINYKTNYRKNKEHEFCSEIKDDDNLEWLPEFVKQSSRVLKNDRALYSFCSFDKVDIFKQEYEKLFNIKNMIIWVKNNHTAGDLEAQYAKKYELILYMNKGRKLINGKRLTDIWEFPRVSGLLQYHQNQKPVDLLRRIIEKSSEPVDTVLDPFAGSGSTLLACEETNTKWIGIETEKKYCDIIVERLSHTKKVLF